MPSTSRKRRSTGRVYETIDRPRQTHFTPRNRTVASRVYTLSAPRTRQQTLTQIDFVSRVPADEEGEDLDYIFEDAPRLRKRRKTMPDTVSAPTAQAKKTRSTKRKAARNDRLEDGGTAVENEPGEASTQTEPGISTNTAMPPPKTPRKTIKTEIPSSQSPATTPLSIQSRPSTRHQSRSPLKAKSTNIRNSPSVHARTIKKISWTPRLEVKDTFDDENEAPQAILPIERSESNLTEGVSEHDFASNNPSGGTFTIPNSRSDSGLSLSKESEAATCEVPTTQPTQPIKTEVRDSDSEGEEDDLDEEDFGAGADTQAALDHVEILVSSSSNEPSLCSDPIDEQPHSISADADTTETFTHGDEAAVPTSILDTPSKNHRFLRLYTSRNLQPPISAPSQPHTPPTQPSPSDEASAQLYADLDRHTQTQSQTPLPRPHRTSLLEKASRPASPPKPAHNRYTHNRNTQRTQTQTQATQNLLPNAPHSSPHSRVPLSQATTTDITQRSPLASRTQLPPSSQLPAGSETQIPSSPQLQSQYLPVLPPSSPSHHPDSVTNSPAQQASSINPALAQAFATDPQFDAQTAPLAFSSSPLQGDGGGSHRASPLWDGEPLTDSQLLPDSLMDMTLPPPPPPMVWTQESLMEEGGEEGGWANRAG